MDVNKRKSINLTASQKSQLAEIYKHYDEKQLFEEGKELLDNNAQLTALKWDSRFWKIVKILVIVVIIGIIMTYVFVFYQSYQFGKHMHESQEIQIHKALGDQNE